MVLLTVSVTISTKMIGFRTRLLKIINELRIMIILKSRVRL